MSACIPLSRRSYCSDLLKFVAFVDVTVENGVTFKCDKAAAAVEWIRCSPLLSRFGTVRCGDGNNNENEKTKLSQLSSQQ